jgi:hypothetical protein
MSERDDNNWITSLERAIEVTEGQIALATAVQVGSITVQVDRAQVLIDGLRDLQRRVGQLESERR